MREYFGDRGFDWGLGIEAHSFTRTVRTTDTYCTVRYFVQYVHRTVLLCCAKIEFKIWQQGKRRGPDRPGFYFMIRILHTNDADDTLCICILWKILSNIISWHCSVPKFGCICHFWGINDDPSLDSSDPCQINLVRQTNSFYFSEGCIPLKSTVASTWIIFIHVINYFIRLVHNISYLLLITQN